MENPIKTIETKVMMILISFLRLKREKETENRKIETKRRMN